MERKSIIKQILSIKLYYHILHSKQIYEGALDPVDNLRTALDPVDNLRTMQLICGSN